MGSVIACFNCPLWDQEHDLAHLKNNLAAKQATIDYQSLTITALSHDLQATRLTLAETVTRLKRLETENRARKRAARKARAKRAETADLTAIDWFGGS